MKTVPVQKLSFLLSEGEITLDLLVPPMLENSRPLSMNSRRDHILQRALALNNRVAEFISHERDEEEESVKQRLAKAIVFVTRVYKAIISRRGTEDAGHSIQRAELAQRDDLTEQHTLEEMKWVHREYMLSFIALVESIHRRMSQLSLRATAASQKEANVSDRSQPGTVGDLVGFKERERWRVLVIALLPEDSRCDDIGMETSRPRGLGVDTMSRVDLDREGCQPIRLTTFDLL
jgi:hypothetical protein